ncbi:hypothetical protein JCGZ_01474 [Jatropha curcas]|uniref:TF-B3 domain-containing protein n=1 Tax=Jatropha curcas TaxID=180498 RepID=A0A067LKV0_JATCU|nr:hypothetical protein JCGZ_01474 [Jatropha curcas]
MASLQKRDNISLMFEADKPHFFKIILEDSVRDGKLSIPKKFARKYGDNLPSSTVLEVPSGKKWSIELIKSDDEIWFKNGWQEFADFYALATGYMLVFQYDKKNSHFNVIILDKSASEIDYPYNNPEKELQVPKSEEETHIDVSAEILYDLSTSQKTRKKSPLSFSQPSKKMKVHHSTSNDKAEKRNAGLFIGPQREDGVMARKQPLRAEEKANVLQKAKINFKSENPYFIVAVQPTYLGNRLAVPSTFAKKYFKQERGVATLSTSDGKNWSAEYCNLAWNGIPLARLCNGWRKFVKENHLEVGDVCAFELINRDNIELKVTVTRHVEEGNKEQSVGENSTSRENTQESPASDSPITVEAITEFSSPYPFFKLVISASVLGRSNAHVPHNFVSKIQQKAVEAKLQVENNLWHVNLNIYRHYNANRGLFCGGWRQFARGNSLKVGDICVFELIDDENAVFKVSIFRHVNQSLHA